jgi:hypothetical protein
MKPPSANLYIGGGASAPVWSYGEVLMRGWFLIFCEVGVGRLQEISMLVKKGPNRRS